MFFHVGSQAVAVGVIAVLVVLDAVAVLARLYTRRSLKQAMQTDDWLIIPALIMAIGMAGAFFTGVAQDVLFNQSPDMVPKHDGPLSGGLLNAFTVSKKIEFAIILMSIITLSFIKLSFLFFYGRVFLYDKRNLWNLRNIVVYATIFLVTLWGLGFGITYLAACGGDFQAHWSSSTFQTKCINTFWMLYGLAISDFVTDCVIILIPIPIIWKLHLDPGRKLGILIVFLLGSLATAASLIRLIWLRWVIRIGATPRKHADPLSLISTELFWYLIEVTVALLAVCLPPLSGLRRTQPVERVIRSVQSKLSLRSNRSAGVVAVPLQEIHVAPTSELISERQISGRVAGQRLGVLPDETDR